MIIEDDIEVLWSGKSCGCGGDEMGLKWVGKVDVDGRNVVLFSVVFGVSVLRIFGLRIVVGID